MIDNNKLSFVDKSHYAMGSVACCLMGNIILVLAMPIYNIGLGVSAALIGYALAIPTLWDAVSDVFMGSISDNIRSRWGRRRPCIFVGAILTGFLGILLWIPPLSLSEKGLFWYFCIISVFYFTGFTIFSIPYHALGMELTYDALERTKVMTFKTIFQNIAGVALLPWAYKLCFLPVFGENEIQGVRVVGAIFGLLMIVTGIWPAIFCRENIEVQTQTHLSFKDSVKSTIKNKPFWLLTTAMFMVIAGVYIVMPLGSYISIYYVFGGNKNAAATLIALSMTIGNVGGIVFAPLAIYISKRLGKKRTFMLGLAMVSLSFLFSWFLYTPKYPYLQLIVPILSAPGMALIWILSSSILADICDIDEQQTGLRREGAYSAVYSLIFKLGLTGSLAVAGYIVSFTGFDVNEVVQTADTILKIRLFFTLIPTMFLIIALSLIRIYTVNGDHVKNAELFVENRHTDDLAEHV